MEFGRRREKGGGTVCSLGRLSNWERWFLTFVRAAHFKQALKDGTIDQDGYNDFFAKLYGLTAQDDYNAGVAQQVEEILGA